MGLLLHKLGQNIKINVIHCRNPPPSFAGGAMAGSTIDRFGVDTDAYLSVPEDWNILV